MLQHMLRQPVRLRTLTVNIHLRAMHRRIHIGIAVNAHKVVRPPAVGGIHPHGKTAGIVRPQNYIRRFPAQPHLKAGVRQQKPRQHRADFIVHILLPQPMALSSGIVPHRVMPLVNKNSDCHKDYHLSQFIVCWPQR